MSCRLLILCAFSNIFLTILAFQEDQTYWKNIGLQELKNSLNIEKNENTAKNVILFLGDGLGLTTITASRIYSKTESGFLAWEKFNHIGVIKTYSADDLVTDSCSAASAIFSGVKINRKTSGVDASVELDQCQASLKKEAQLDSFFTWAMDAGKKTGFVTTTRVTHATPSALYAHTPNRNWECESTIPETAKMCKDIARQLIEDLPGKNINVIFGGGRQCLVSNVTNSAQDPIDTWSCASKDGRNLINDWISDKKSRQVTHAFVSNAQELHDLDPNKKDFVLGIFANGHLKYEYERDKGPLGMPSLTNMTLKAIDVLDQNPNGYVLMVEGGLIDMAHHRGHARIALEETVSFSDAIEATLQKIDLKNTLVIVTSDHSHSLVFTGYEDRRNSILDLAKTPSKIDGIPYTPLLYGTGGPNNYQYTIKDTKPVRQDPSLENTKAFEYSQQATVLTDEVAHSGTDVLIYATGPMSHLVHSVREQTFIAYVISYAAKIGPMKDFKASSSSGNFCQLWLLFLGPIIYCLIF